VTTRQRVAVVTGGGGGIGGAIAEELGRAGWFVVTVDPLVTLEGTAQLVEPPETTADRIVKAGGSARASAASVTDGEALRTLFEELSLEHEGLDAVVNVAGITRQTYFASGTEEDWLAVATVHLDGYLNVLGAALPLMAAAGHGRIVGVTSGSGWRAADAGGYSCAKRAVASLTWQLGRHCPPGVTVNALSPIAATRMVAAALERARAAGRAGGGGGLTLDSMPGPEDLAPLGAHVLGHAFGWCNGRVLFAGGSEVAMVDEPRLIEVVRTDGARSLDRVLDAVVPRALATAEAAQSTTGATNPRFRSVFDEPGPAPQPSATVRRCALVTDRPEFAGALGSGLEARSIDCHRVELEGGFDAAGRALLALAERAGPLDAVVLAPTGRTGPPAAEGWARVLADHTGIVADLHTDASWWRAAADYAEAAARPVRLVTITDAVTAGGHSRAQVAAQQARVAGGVTRGAVLAFAVALETDGGGGVAASGSLAAHLLATPDAEALAGAELVVGGGWLGLRSHPRPLGAVTYGGPDIPDWLDPALQEMAGVAGPVTGPDDR
jgi:NAD(P)-dependent dehydrogenase (short-subunit alcohol dehydrogenase family)